MDPIDETSPSGKLEMQDPEQPDHQPDHRKGLTNQDIGSDRESVNIERSQDDDPLESLFSQRSLDPVEVQNYSDLIEFLVSQPSLNPIQEIKPSVLRGLIIESQRKTSRDRVARQQYNIQAPKQLRKKEEEEKEKELVCSS